MRIQDPSGRLIEETTITLTRDEVTELLVAVSRLDDAASDHEILRDEAGTAIALYRGELSDPLERQTDWWVGPLILILVILAAVGAFTIGRGIIELLF
jgi:hypothetical protein